MYQFVTTDHASFVIVSMIFGDIMNPAALSQHFGRKLANIADKSVIITNTETGESITIDPDKE